MVIRTCEKKKKLEQECKRNKKQDSPTFYEENTLKVYENAIGRGAACGPHLSLLEPQVLAISLIPAPHPA